MPKHFVEKGNDKLVDLIERNALGTLVVLHEEEFEINHIPFLIDRERSGGGKASGMRLRAHVPRANPLSSILLKDRDCTVIFQDANGYVSPSWYASKQEHGKVVPTWNYSVVHVHGKITVKDDPQWVLSQLNDMTAKHEESRTVKWAVSDAPDDYINSRVAALVGLEVSIVRMDGKTKASQNQPEKNQASVLAALQVEQPESEFAAMMESALDQSS